MHHEGEQVARFLATVFNVDVTQQPELTLGPAGLRRPQLQKLAELIGEKFRTGPNGETISGKDMIPTVNEWFLAGRFDSLAASRDPVVLPTAANNRRELEAERAKNKILEERLDRLERLMTTAIDRKTTSEQIGILVNEEQAQQEIENDDILSADTPTALSNLKPAFEVKDEAELDSLGLTDIRALAKSLKIAVKGRSLAEMVRDIKIKWLMIPREDGTYALDGAVSVGKTEGAEDEQDAA